MSKSCRNCERSRHDGYFYIRLICRVTSEVVLPFSKSLDENKTYDEKLRARAATCAHYTPDH